VTWAISVQILVFLGLSILDLGSMYATYRRQTKASLNALPIRVGGVIIQNTFNDDCLVSRIRVKIIRTAACCVVYRSSMYTQTCSSSLELVEFITSSRDIIFACLFVRLSAV